MSRKFQKRAIEYISRKNTHDLVYLCREYDIPAQQEQLLCEFAGVYGSRNQVLAKLDTLCDDFAEETLRELKALSGLLEQLPWSDRIIFDFSVVNNMSYYNGIVFTGFISGVSEGILAGGQYDKLMQKLHRKSGAIGFAVYLDLLEQLRHQKADYDVDVLLIYQPETSHADVANRVEQLIAEGCTVSAQRTVPPKLRYRKLIHL